MSGKDRLILRALLYLLSNYEDYQAVCIKTDIKDALNEEDE